MFLVFLVFRQFFKIVIDAVADEIFNQPHRTVEQRCIDQQRKQYCAICTHHIKHFLSLGYESAVALGCDYDGIETPPTGLESPERLAEFKTLLKANGISNGTADGIFYNNARAFFETNNIKPINA